MAGSTSRSVVVSMRDSLPHRGPDAAGVKCWPDAALAHRRLAIIDLEGGKQPLANEDESIWVTYNGKIYYYPELRKDLEQSGR